ncbi:MAG TPA: MarR family transcriptional regulator [Candidatus Omnitrophota bacterium]|nr:MarR family transcriptional regulator [Candidatus Omnitrophota bacterium]HPB68017.1 MarR family transcriptional regulator [Candidatus Omnitrophota bacterium]HQO57857.1 MarR family transcriptional regulator [Candidatus Omnitrophota bacterium]HQP12694.1 MarR family transcriptional regulator [Candidatus Omnitrophota bacterium]
MSDLSRYGIIEEETPSQERALYSLALIFNICHNELTAFLRPYQLTPGKLNILVAIRYHGGKAGLSQVEVSKHLIVTPSNMTKLIDKLEQEGLVSRSACAGDRRVNVVRVTKKAEDLLDSLWGRYVQKMHGFMEPLSKKEQDTLSVLLMKWLASLTA